MYAGYSALPIAGLPNLPGFLVTVKLVAEDRVPALSISGYHCAWLIGFAVASGSSLLFKMPRAHPHQP